MSESFPIESPSGLRVHVNANGSIRRMDFRDVILNLFVGNEIEGGPANLYLRRRGRRIDVVPLLGPRSPARVDLAANRLRVSGEWEDLRFDVSLVLVQSAPAWLWRVNVQNVGDSTVKVDLIYAQDLALSSYDAVRRNEYYVSQYVDYTPLVHATCGTVLAVRQNLPHDWRHPWAVIGSLAKGVSFATDALQLHGLGTRAGGLPSALRRALLPGKRQQHEHSMAVIQDAASRLAPGETVERGFFGWFETDHPSASSLADLEFVDRALALPETAETLDRAGLIEPTAIVPTLFSTAPLFDSRDLTDSEISKRFDAARRHAEYDNDRLLSFFTDDNRHVVLKAKESQVLRPHGHILRSGNRLVPDEESLTSTTWMAGVFNSLLTQGHVSINRLLSTTRSYLGLLRAGGQRIFVEQEEGYVLLDVPSAFEMSPNACRWIYKDRGGVIEIRTAAALDCHEINLSIAILRGPARRFLLSHHVAINGDDGGDDLPVRFRHDGNGIAIHPFIEGEIGRRFPQGFFRVDTDRATVLEHVGGDELLFADGVSRQQPFLTMVTAKTKAVHLRLTGHLIASPLTIPTTTTKEAAAVKAEEFSRLTRDLLLHAPSNGACADELQRLQAIVPWFTHNALIHYLAPRGLEQYSGGGWGTRDVSQGPVEMLLALGLWQPLRDLLLRLFKAQNADGDWPQWFMFFERERSIRPGDSHGDIVFWPLLALAQYLLATDDAALLDTVVPFFHVDGDDHAEQADLSEHVERALAVIDARLVPGTHLAAYGHGDWNDSLQPVDPSMRERLCSSWTVTLHHQTLSALGKALRQVGRIDAAKRLEARTPPIRADFQRLLIADDTLAGFAYFHPDERIDYLLHPRDAATGIHYRLLPMIHAIINDLFTPEQAAAHVRCIKEHLLGPDGARLFDRPPTYQGGPQRFFQRAESSTYCGREIGLMYMHAHLRYAEAMAHYGDADAFFLALQQVNPIGLPQLVEAALPRQANCYYSSSDAVFADRYDAQAGYRRVLRGEVPLEGGWRIYSSGAGIAVRLIHECLLGIRRSKTALIIDPVLPQRLDGMSAEIELAGKPLVVSYRIGARGCGPTHLTLNDIALRFESLPNPYRQGGARVWMTALSDLLNDQRNQLDVQLA